MAILIWLVPIVALTVLAAGWTTWRNRPRREPTMQESMAAHQRFVNALARDRDRGRP